MTLVMKTPVRKWRDQKVAEFLEEMTLDDIRIESTPLGCFWSFFEDDPRRKYGSGCDMRSCVLCLPQGDAPIANTYQLPGYPHDIEDHPDHPLYDAAMWDKRFMKEQGWTWTEFYGALVELRTGHNPNHPSHTPALYYGFRYDRGAGEW